MIGELLGPFRIEAKLGQGAMGVVYKATYERLGKPVAIKVISRESAGEIGGKRFKRESDILGQFKHPNIVKHYVFATDKARGLNYYAMEYVPGGTLETLLQSRGALPWQEVVDYAIQICHALDYAHEKKIIHRDLKPSNLLVTESGQIKLSDFGIAKPLDQTALTAPGRTIGTAAYMAPEQIRGTPELSHKTDLYALGCILYEMLTGSPPFTGQTTLALMHKQLEEPAPRVGSKNALIPVELDKLVDKLMAKDPESRPWDAIAVLHVLEDLRDQAASGEPIATVGGPRVARKRAVGDETTEAATALREAMATRAKKAKKKKRRATSEDMLPPFDTVRHRLEMGGLAVALIAGLGLLGYFLWPSSAAYLHREATRYMSQPDRESWKFALSEYVSELERRFPNNPYKEEIRGWKDQILLDDAHRRASYLQSPSEAGPNKPRNDAERAYKDTYLAATKLDENKQDLKALQSWNDLVKNLPEQSDDDRAMNLLARERAAEQAAQVKKRMEEVERLMMVADRANRKGDVDEAVQNWRHVVTEYGEFESVHPRIADAVNAIAAHVIEEALPGAESPPEEP